MTYAEARRAFSIVVDIARSRTTLMDLTTSPDSVAIWDASEGELHLTNVGSDAYPDYELDWEGNVMMHAVAAGEPAQQSSRILMADGTCQAV